MVYTILFSLIGAIAGFLLGSFGVYYGCIAYDYLSYPEGVSAGGGAVAVGWLLCFVTVPLGTVYGLVTGIRLSKRLRLPVK